MKKVKKGITIIDQLNSNMSRPCLPSIGTMNVTNVTDSVLYARESFYAENGGGRNVGAVWMYIFSTLLVTCFYKWSSGEVPLYILIILASVSLPFFIIWRFELPICFNRKTGQVSFWKDEELLQANWDQLEFYRASKRTSAGPATIIDLPILLFNLFGRTSGKEINIRIIGTKHDSNAKPLSDFDQIEGLWKYIYLFMNEGKQSLPDMYIKNNIKCSFIGSIKSRNPFSFICAECNSLDYTIGIILLPVSIPFYFLAVPTDLIYCALDKILPHRPLPKALREACEAE